MEHGSPARQLNRPRVPQVYSSFHVIGGGHDRGRGGWCGAVPSFSRPSPLVSSMRRCFAVRRLRLALLSLVLLAAILRFSSRQLMELEAELPRLTGLGFVQPRLSGLGLVRPRLLVVSVAREDVVPPAVKGQNYLQEKDDPIFLQLIKEAMRDRATHRQAFHKPKHIEVKQKSYMNNDLSMVMARFNAKATSRFDGQGNGMNDDASNECFKFPQIKDDKDSESPSWDKVNQEGIKTAERSFPLCSNYSQKDDARRHFLSAVVVNRVFKEDLLNFTKRQIFEWLEYYRYAGVDHFIWYDNAHSPEELQMVALFPFIQQGVLTYVKMRDDVGIFADVSDDQTNLFRHFMKNFANQTVWALHCDVDEYFFMPQDVHQGFLAHFLRAKPATEDGLLVSQILVPNLFYHGWPVGEPPLMLIERYRRRMPWTERDLRQKAIFRTGHSYGIPLRNPHRTLLKEGKSVFANESFLHMKHYWGPRDFEFGEEPKELKEKLVFDKSIQPIADAIRPDVERLVGP